MKKLNIDVKGITGVAIAVVTGLTAFAGVLADREKTKAIDELIKKVGELTD